MRGKAIMVLGTTSGAGKSWLVTALCRYYAQLGLKVAPFKAQNMSNNARVVAGGEIGSAQYFQALAARAVPEVRMNPLLLKPESDTHSQVIALGQVSSDLTRIPWQDRSEFVWPMIEKALFELMSENDIVVIEGAGSPAEINLKDRDIVNMRVAMAAQANCLLVTDIDRGGAFAHLYGTHTLLAHDEQALIKGFVLNKFRGDARLLAPGPEMLQALTSVPVVATLPMWWQHGLPEEDGLYQHVQTSEEITSTIAIIAYPRISNLDEFQVLNNVPGVQLKWVRAPGDLAEADWLVLPGSKNTSADLLWLRSQGLDKAIANHAAQGKAILGICGGLQMLGEALIDTQSIEGNAAGLGLLPLVTHFEQDKTVRRCQTQFASEMSGIWSALSDVEVSGYEIHHGQTTQHPAMAKAGDVAVCALPTSLGWQNQKGNVLGIYLHGIFEDPAVLKALFGISTPNLDSVFDGLANYIDRYFEPQFLNNFIKN
ncbi:MAG TPA: cobyric acid synthase [Burkholderiaceae bacterium]|nr:cobyric acid synthase [Burkholderiaceae bacterium]